MQYGCKYLTKNVKEFIVDQHPEFNIIFNRLKIGTMVLDRSYDICPHLTDNPAVNDTTTNIFPISRTFYKKSECAVHSLIILRIKKPFTDSVNPQSMKLIPSKQLGCKREIIEQILHLGGSKGERKPLNPLVKRGMLFCRRFR